MTSRASFLPTLLLRSLDLLGIWTGGGGQVGHLLGREESHLAVALGQFTRSVATVVDGGV